MDHTFSATAGRKYEASVAFACLGLAGCTALLGDFSSNSRGWIGVHIRERWI
jgi:hypothetical protein